MSLEDSPGRSADYPALEDATPIVEPAPVVQAADRQPSARRRLRTPLLLLAPIVAALVILYFYLSGGRYEATDNGYIQSGLVSVSANVSGPVVAIAVHNNQRVKAGDVLFRIDPAPYQAAVDEAAAELASARTQVASVRASYREGEATLQAGRDKLAYAQREAARQKALLAEGISSQAQYDQAVLAEQTARQQIQTSVQQNAGVAATLTGSVSAPTERQPSVQRAQAALERARLNLGYTTVRAAQDGIVTKVDQLQLGSYVSAAKPVFTLAGTRLWVEGNFKENQLDHMRVGQRATFKVDAFPDLKLTGRVASFSPGTGNSFALLPPENATGNWVKVVQRLPIEFSIDQLPRDIPLHAGLSVEVTVDTGYQRHLFGAATPVR
ncbi:HlyD family secretion protein [Sphingomonas glacialis]|uniref:HlyD family secretion protein n=1 Tax=Sphingomonas glacialis TaxID=658225 RepID=A0A502FYI1_9SPHN|nr:HlyD family secretion protein [Sphingomonas glacialis]TPG54086.1 HlyD family secretion protein [Sphingomonas glacialis]